MKTKYFIINRLLLGLFAILIAAASCKKEDDALSQARLFRPVLSTPDVQGNQITLSWAGIKGAVSYTIELSRDTFRTIDFSRTVGKDTTGVVFQNLLWNQKYQIRVQANSNDPAFNSKLALTKTIQTDKFPTILVTPQDTDILDNAVRVRWTNSGDAVTKVLIMKSDSSWVEIVSLTAGDVTAQIKKITNLTSATNYKIYIYSGTTIRGWASFMTKPPSLAGNIVDLRPITGRPNVLYDTILQVPSGSIILLQRGLTYSIPNAVLLDRSVTIMSGSDFGSSLATISFASNFDFAANSSVDSIVFRNVILNSPDATSKYIFNVKNTTTIGKISLESCRAEIFRGIMRLQTGTISVSKFSVNNCIIDSIGNYGIVTVDNATSKITDIAVQNSTIFKAQRIIVSSKSSLPVNSVLINNCTFYDNIIASSYLVDYGTTVNVPSFLISNCILGKTRDPLLSRGVRTSTGTTVSVSNTYNTADFIATTNPIPSLIPYSGSSTALFQDPTNVVPNFTIKDKNFSGKGITGDPRWY